MSGLKKPGLENDVDWSKNKGVSLHQIFFEAPPPLLSGVPYPSLPELGSLQYLVPAGLLMPIIPDRGGGKGSVLVHSWQ